MSLVLTQWRETLARLHVVCEALGIHPDEARLHDFADDERARLIGLANEDIRRVINDDTRHPLQKG